MQSEFQIVLSNDMHARSRLTAIQQANKVSPSSSSELFAVDTVVESCNAGGESAEWKNMKTTKILSIGVKRLKMPPSPCYVIFSGKVLCKQGTEVELCSLRVNSANFAEIACGIFELLL